MRRSVRNAFQALGIILLFSLPFVFALAPLWVTGSVITSGIKTFSDDCGKRYPVEFVFGGNWFCPESDND